MSHSKTITELPEELTPAADDVLVIYSVGGEETRKIKRSALTSTGGYTKLVATGAIDDLNTVFGFTQEPSAININGGVYGPGEGVFAWVWDGNTNQATLAIPLGVGGFIHGVL